MDADGGAASGGDDVFYDAYLAPLEDRMLRTAWRITRDPERARDALQDALARLWRHRERVRAHANPQALVLHVCIQAALDVLRRERRWWRLEGGLMPREVKAGGEVDPAALAERRELHGLVVRAIAHLPEKQAAAVTLRLLEDQPYRAIAAALGCDEATARVHALRGRQKLARLLAGFLPAGGHAGDTP